jgi:iron(III) transport system substrate-binding protein
VGVVFPNQQSWGTHLNIAGGAVARYAKNQANAVKFLEYLASASRPRTTLPTATTSGHRQGRGGGQPGAQVHDRRRTFKSETIPLSAVGANTVKVQQMLDRVGFK